MKRLAAPLAFFLVPLVLGCGCVDGQSTCAPPPPPETPPATLSEPAGADEPPAAAEDVVAADAEMPPALALEPR